MDNVREIAIKIIEKIPLPLGLAYGKKVIMLNQEANLFLGNFSIEEIPKSPDQETEIFNLNLGKRLIKVEITKISNGYSLILFGELDIRTIANDELTGLMGRYHFHILAPKLLKEAKDKSKVVIFFLDLDGFKEINDNLGHNIGDEVLKEISSRLTKAIRPTDLCFRWGGDEFLIISAGFVEKIHAGLMARRIIKTTSEPIVVGNRKITVGVSIGISVFPDNGEDLEELVEKADKAMYRAKQKGGSIYCFS